MLHYDNMAKKNTNKESTTLDFQTRINQLESEFEALQSEYTGRSGSAREQKRWQEMIEIHQKSN
jgi:predicted nuclease with TOPRIM domain